MSDRNLSPASPDTGIRPTDPTATPEGGMKTEPGSFRLALLYFGIPLLLLVLLIVLRKPG